MRIPSVFFFPCADGEEVFASNGPYAVITDQKRLSELICMLKQKTAISFSHSRTSCLQQWNVKENFVIERDCLYVL